MRLLYHIQQRMAITAVECKALLVLMALFLIGLGVRYTQAHWLEVRPAETPFITPLVHSWPDSMSTPLIQAVAGDTLDEESKQDTTASAPKHTEPSKRAGAKADPAVRMNLNTASVRLLQQLPGIGPKLAERVVAYRTAHGPFKRVEDIIRVKGIGKKTYEKLAPRLFVADGDTVASQRR